MLWHSLAPGNGKKCALDGKIDTVWCMPKFCQSQRGLWLYSENDNRQWWREKSRRKTGGQCAFKTPKKGGGWFTNSPELLMVTCRMSCRRSLRHKALGGHHLGVRPRGEKETLVCLLRIKGEGEGNEHWVPTTWTSLPFFFLLLVLWHQRGKPRCKRKIGSIFYWFSAREANSSLDLCQCERSVLAGLCCSLVQHAADVILVVLQGLKLGLYEDECEPREGVIVCICVW